MIEAHFRYFYPCAQVKIGTTGITDIIEFGLTVQALQRPNDIDSAYAGIDQLCITQIQS